MGPNCLTLAPYSDILLKELDFEEIQQATQFLLACKDGVTCIMIQIVTCCNFKANILPLKAHFGPLLTLFIVQAYMT